MTENIFQTSLIQGLLNFLFQSQDYNQSQLKFRHYEKATEFEKNIPPVSTKQLFLLSSIKTSGGFFQILWPLQKS